MRIHRSHPDEHFTIIPNETLRDQRLSYNARGVLMELLSHVDGWETNADALSQLARRHRGERPGEGRRALRSVFAELEELGYLVRRRERREGGKFVTTLDLFDTPGHRDTASGASVNEADPWAVVDRGTAGGTSVSGTSADGTSVTGTSTRSTNLRTTNEEEPSEEHSTSLADARAAAADAAARSRAEAERKHYGEIVKQLPDADLRNFMFLFETRRPKVYRECRRDADAWLKEKQPHLRKVANRAAIRDQATYLYALLHYRPEPPKRSRWEPWVIKPLTEFQQSREAA